MVKMVVLYGHPADAAAFEDYYATTHVPLAEKIPDVRRFESGRVMPAQDGSAPPYHRVAELWFDSVESLQAATDTPEGQATVDDLPKFATGGVTLLVTDLD